MKIKTSVALCTYNGEKFLVEQLESILNQTIQVDEIIICDDCSSDNTRKIIEEFENKYPKLLKVFINKKNLKSVKNFEKAIKKCSGDFIFLSDQDDIWVIDKVESYLKYFHENPNIEVLASNGYCVNENSEVQEKYSIWDFQLFFNENKIQFGYNEIITLISNIATGASMAIRKSFANEIFPIPILKDFHHDEWIAMLSSKKNTFHLLDEKYFYYRIHESQSVGGIFYDKNSKSKNSIIETFNINAVNIKFKGYKKLIKRLCKSYEKYSQLNDLVLENYQELTSSNLLLIAEKKAELLTEMNKNFPLKSALLKVTDFILNKRKN